METSAKTALNVRELFVEIGNIVAIHSFPYVIANDSQEIAEDSSSSRERSIPYCPSKEGVLEVLLMYFLYQCHSVMFEGLVGTQVLLAGFPVRTGRL